MGGSCLSPRQGREKREAEQKALKAQKDAEERRRREAEEEEARPDAEWGTRGLVVERTPVEPHPTQEESITLKDLKSLNLFWGIWASLQGHPTRSVRAQGRIPVQPNGRRWSRGRRWQEQEAKWVEASVA